MSDAIDDKRKLLDGLIDLAGQHAHKILIQRRETALTPICHFIDRDGKSMIIACLWDTDFQKQLLKAHLKKTSRDIGATAAVFLAEAWITKPPIPLTSWHKQRQTYTPPSQDPKRQEVVIATATTGDQEVAGMWQIVRDKPGGRIISLVKDELVSDPNVRIAGDLLDGLVQP